VNLLLDFGHHFLRVVVRGHLSSQHRQRSTDSSQRVADLVGDPARQFSHCCEPLIADQFPLERCHVVAVALSIPEQQRRDANRHQHAGADAPGDVHPMHEAFARIRPVGVLDQIPPQQQRARGGESQHRDPAECQTPALNPETRILFDGFHRSCLGAGCAIVRTDVGNRSSFQQLKAV